MIRKDVSPREEIFHFREDLEKNPDLWLEANVPYTPTYKRYRMMYENARSEVLRYEGVGVLTNAELGVRVEFKAYELLRPKFDPETALAIQQQIAHKRKELSSSLEKIYEELRSGVSPNRIELDYDTGDITIEEDEFLLMEKLGSRWDRVREQGVDLIKLWKTMLI